MSFSDNKVLKFCLLSVSIFLLFFALSHKAQAAAYTWDGGGADGTCGGAAGDGNKWSCNLNWSSDITPTSSDSVTFNSGNTKDATIDSSFQGTVTGFTISSGYTGIITQARTVTINGSYSQADGTFTGGSQTIDINSGSWSLTNGSFTSTSGTMTIEISFTKSGGTFTHNSGTVTFDSANSATVDCGGDIFNQVNISKHVFAAFVVSSGCTVRLGNSPTSSANSITNNGTMILGTGTWTYGAYWASTNGYSQGSSGNLTFSGTIMDFNAASLSLTAGSVSLPNLTTIRVDGNLNNSGSLLPNGLTLNVDGTDRNDSSLTCGTVTWGLVTLNKGSTTYITVGSDCTLPLGNNPTTAANNITNNGAITIGTGTWTHTGYWASNTNGYSQSSTGSLTSLATTITFYTGSFHLESGTASFTNLTTINLGGSLYNSSNLLPTTGLTVNLIEGQDSTHTLDCGTSTFSSANININLQSTTIGSTCTLPLGNNSTTNANSITNNGTISIGGTWTINGYWAGSSGYTQSSTASIVATAGSTISTVNFNVTLTAGSVSQNISTISIGGSLNNSASLLPDGVALTVVNGYNSTLTCGTDIFGSVTINTAFTTTFASDCNISGNLTRTDGAINNPGAARTWYVGGNFSASTTDQFAGSNLTIELNGTGTQTITQNASHTFAGTFRINKASGTARLATNFSYGSTACPVTAGTLDLHSFNLTCSSVTVSSGATLQLYGSETFTAPTLNSGSTVKFTGDGDSAADTYTITSGITAFQHLTINSTDSTTDTFQLGAIATAGGDFALSAGAFNQGASYNFTVSGTSTISSGTTYTNTGTGDITLGGTLTNSGRITLRSNGACGGSDDIVIASTSGGAQRSWNGTGRYYMSDLTVSDMGGSGAIYLGSSTSTSNNDTNWHFNDCQTFSQTDYQWFENADAVQPGSSLGSQSTATTVPDSRQAVRLRANVTTNDIPVYSGDGSGYKLQYAINTTSGNTGSSWWNSSWLNRKKITFQSPGNAAITDFPYLVTLTTSNFDYGKTKAAGADIRFVDPDGTSLSYEIEKWDSSGTSNIWVKVPQIDVSGSGDYMYMYYNNPAATDSQAATSVWDTNFKGVWHLPNGTTLTTSDSTGVNNGTNSGTTAATGQIDGGASFNGSTSQISVSDSNSLDLTTAGTISLWAKNNGSGYAFIVSKKDGTNDYTQTNGYMFYGSNGSIDVLGAGQGGSANFTRYTTSIDTDWHYWVGQYNGTAQVLYKDGVLQSGTVTGTPANLTAGTQGLLIGDRTYSGEPSVNGLMDEVRISNSVRSADWVAAEYSTGAGTMGMMGNQESQTSGDPGFWYDLGSSWWNTSWLNRKKFTFDNSSSNSNLVNFPALISLTTSNFDYSKTQSAGQDIRFLDSDGTQLNYEIESWNSSGTSYIWVKVPQIDKSSTSDYIMMYYNNSGASDGQVATSVWDSNFKSVWHLSNSSSPATDSTSIGNSASQSGGVTFQATGQVAKAVTVASASSQKLAASATNLQGTTFTYEAWVNSSSNPTSGNLKAFLEIGDVSSRDQLVYLANNYFGNTGWGFGSYNTDGTNIAANFGSMPSTSTWYHVVGVRDASNITLYVNGQQAAQTSTSSKTASFGTSPAAYIGNRNNTQYFDGSLDEVRVSNTARSADWIKAEYKTATNTMGNFGLQETLGAETLNPSWTFKNNSSVTTDTAISSILLSSSDLVGTYQESNSTPIYASDIWPAETIEYDFALVPTARAYIGTTYYFRIAKSDGSPLDTYTNYCQVSIGSLNAGGGGATGGSSGGGTPTTGGGSSGDSGGTGGSSGGGTPTGGGGQGGGGGT